MNQTLYKKILCAAGEWLLTAAFLYSTLFLYLSDFCMDTQELNDVPFLKTEAAWGMPAEGFLLVGAAAIGGFVVWGVYGQKPKKRWALFYDIALVGYGLYEIKRLTAGFFLFINPWLKQLALYHEVNFPLFVAGDTDEGKAPVLVLLFLVLVLLLMAPPAARMVCRGRGRLAFVLAGIWPLALRLLTGQVPEAGAFSLWLILFLVLLWTGQKDRTLGEHQERIKTAVFLCSTLVLLALFTSSIFTPEFYEERIDVTEPKAKLQQAGGKWLEDLQNLTQKWQKGTGGQGIFSVGSSTAAGLSGGRLMEAGSLSYTGRTALRLSYVKEGEVLAPLFLRGYIGEIYTGRSWESAKDFRSYEDYREIMEKFGERGIYIDSQEIFPMELLKTKTRSFAVDNVNGGKGRVYVPYAVMEPVEFDEDGYIKLWGKEPEKAYALRIAKNPPRYWELLEVLNAVGGDEAGSYIQQTREYEGLIKELYLQLPENSRIGDMVKKRFPEAASGGVPLLVGEAVDYVKSTLSQQAVYTLTPGRVPAGEDFADYFFFENKKGYCMHFATAGTLMFRALGIPARYTEGYVASKEEIRAAEDTVSMGEPVEMLVADRNAHAWIEIYVAGAGWIPVEVTPGYVLDGREGIEQLPDALREEILPEESQTPEDSGESNPPEETRIPEPSIEPDSQDGEPKPEELSERERIPEWLKRAAGVLLRVLSGAGAVFFTAWLRRSCVLYKKRRELSQADEAEKIRIYYREVLWYLKEKEICWQGEPLEEWSRRVKEESSLPEGFGEFATLAYKAAFAEKITREERKEAKKYYHTFWEKIYQSFSEKDKLFYKYFKIFEEL